MHTKHKQTNTKMQRKDDRGVFLANNLASNDNLTRTTKRQYTYNENKLTIHKKRP